MSRGPTFLEHKQVPDEDILRRVKTMIKDGKGPKKMKEELPGMSLYTINTYYSKVKRGIW